MSNSLTQNLVTQNLPELGNSLVEKLYQLQYVDVNVLDELDICVICGFLAVGDRQLGQSSRDAAEDGVEVVDAQREEHLGGELADLEDLLAGRLRQRRRRRAGRALAGGHVEERADLLEEHLDVHGVVVLGGLGAGRRAQALLEGVEHDVEALIVVTLKLRDLRLSFN